jgi:hypothetical protein
MTLDDFRHSPTAAKPPAELTLVLVGLWCWDAKGDRKGSRNGVAGRRPLSVLEL